MINIGVIGAGRIGRIHAQSIQEKVQGAQVKTIADVFEESEIGRASCRERV